MRAFETSGLVPAGLTPVGMAAFSRGLGALVPVDVDAGYTPGEVVEVRHGLGYVPRGYVVVRNVAAGGPAQVWEEADDVEWDAVSLGVRVDTADVRLLLWVF